MKERLLAFFILLFPVAVFIFYAIFNIYMLLNFKNCDNTLLWISIILNIISAISAKGKGLSTMLLLCISSIFVQKDLFLGIAFGLIIEEVLLAIFGIFNFIFMGIAAIIAKCKTK